MLWWALGLIVVAAVFTYRKEVLNIVWNRPAQVNNSLFATNPAVYTADVIAHGVANIGGSVISSLVP